MNQLITMPPVEIVTDNFCRHCGSPLVPHSNFCGECGAGCRDLIATGDSNSRSPVGLVTAEPISIGAAGAGTQAIKAVLNSRLAVIGIIAFIGPPGLLALWFSPRFAKPTKIISTAAYILLTTVVPLAIAWYWLDYAMRPLVDVFGK